MMTGLPELRIMVEQLRRRRWIVHLYGDPKAPTIFAAVHHWGIEQCADVLILRGHDRAVAYRVPTYDKVDVFAPEWVHWWYAQSGHPTAALWTFRAVLALSPPPCGGHIEIQTAPPFCRLDPRGQCPVTIRPL